MIEYVHSRAMTSTMLTPMHGTECKGLGKILGLAVGVIASIAVPFLAPVIGTALGGGFFASIAGQALIGAGLGALGGAGGAAISGGDILKGALLGGAGGALTGGAGSFLKGAGLTTAGAGAGAGIPTIDPLTGFENANVALGAAGIGGAAGATTALAGATEGVAPGALAGTAAATPAAAPGILSGLSTGFKTAAVNSIIQGGTQMLQSLMPDQQAELFKKMQAEMEVTRTQDAAAYAAQKKIFDEYYNYAKGINPEFFSQLERANEQQRLSTTWADTERSLRSAGYSPAAIASERRKQEIQGVAGLNTASAGGLLKGMDAQGAALRTASSLYPKTDPNYLANLSTMYNIAGDRAADTSKGIAGLVAPWQVYAQGLIEKNPNARV